MSLFCPFVDGDYSKVCFVIKTLTSVDIFVAVIKSGVIMNNRVRDTSLPYRRKLKISEYAVKTERHFTNRYYYL